MNLPTRKVEKEKIFNENEFIVSKTDSRGVIKYVNNVFLRVSGYTEKEVLGKPHNLIRHPDMPKCVFKLLWDTIKGGNEIFAYVINKTKLGDYYWVFAHVTPTFDNDGNVTGYHSNRRVARKAATEVVKGLYKALLEEEKKHDTPQKGTQAAFDMLLNILDEKGVSYDEFVLSL